MPGDARSQGTDSISHMTSYCKIMLVYFEIWQGFWQQCCWGICQILEWLETSEYRSHPFETLQDLATRYLMQMVLTVTLSWNMPVSAPERLRNFCFIVTTHQYAHCQQQLWSLICCNQNHWRCSAQQLSFEQNHFVYLLVMQPLLLSEPNWNLLPQIYSAGKHIDAA